MSKRHCESCGYIVQPIDRFCLKCGAPLSSIKSAHSPKIGWPIIILGGIGLLLIVAAVVFNALLGGPSSEVRWYKREGLQVINGEAQYTLSLIQPEKGEPTFEELTQLALARDSSFFTGVHLNEITYLSDIPGGEDFRAYLLGKGYKNLGINLVAFEVIGRLPVRR